MALQHKIKWEIALSCRKKKSENNLEFPFKSRTDAAARRPLSPHRHVQKQQKPFKSESLI